MLKRNIFLASKLSAFVLGTLCLLSSVTAQKGTAGTDGSVHPVKGIDVIVQKNPGDTASRTVTTDDNGEAKFVGLAPGHYSVSIGAPPKQEKAGNVKTVVADNYDVEIVGAVGGPIKREWNVKARKFATMSNASTAKTSAPKYEDKIDFDIAGGNGPTPTLTTIIRSKSNITNN